MNGNSRSVTPASSSVDGGRRASLDSLGCIFIDFENFLLSLSNQYGHSPADAQAKTLNIIGQVERFLADQGVQIVLRRAYADWSQYPDAMKELYRMGVQVVNVGSTPRKNSADIELSLSLTGSNVDSKRDQRSMSPRDYQAMVKSHRSWQPDESLSLSLFKPSCSFHF